MSGKRSYPDPCGVARALDVIEGRWGLLVVRELLLGPKRFTDLVTGLPGASQNVLSQRLRELEDAGIVTRRRLGPPAAVRVYDLTPRGRELEPVLLALSRWGSRAPLPADGELSADALLLALRTTFRPDGLPATVALHLDDDRVVVEVPPDGDLQVRRGEAGRADAVLLADAPSLRALVFGGRPVAELEAAGRLRVEGDRTVAERFASLFPRPQSA
jgi:DNA-binding HxlR family transcriptional regulator